MNRSIICFACSLISLMILGSDAYAVQPQLSSVNPTGIQQGTTATVSFAGRRLGDAEEMMFYEPGIAASDIKKVDDNRVTAVLTIDEKCRPGLHAIRVRTESGISDIRFISIGAMKQVKEVEPNSNFAEPQAIELNTTVSGVVQLEDEDFFVVEAKKGQRITAEVEGLRLGTFFFDPYVAILNPQRFELARSDDSALLRQDGVCSTVVPEDGKYIIQVRETAFQGNGACRYRLHVGTFPRPRAVFPAGGKPGEEVEARWIENDTSWVEKVKLPDQSHDEYMLFASNENGMAPSANRVRVNALDNTNEVEPNNSRSVATPASAPGALNGIIQESGDIDYYKITARKNQQFDVKVYARSPLRSPLDSVLGVYDANGRGVVSNDDAGKPDSSLRFRAPADGDYYVMVRDHLRSGGPDFVYRVEIVPVAPELTLGIPEKVRYFATTMPVPQGNRGAMMITASRRNFGGDLNLAFEGLPQGMTFKTVPMPANRTTIPVLFEAASDAPTSGTLVEMTATPVDEKIKVSGRLVQRTMLVRGQNNREVWGHSAHRLAAAVTKQAPFSIEIVQPEVPIVRNGSMQLKVIAHRQEEFKAPIALRFLYNPPGVTASGSVRIAEGKSEALIPLTANGSASVGVWPIIVTGRATHEGGILEIATQMADLEVADSFFNIAIQKSAGELGKPTEVFVKIEHKKRFEGEAEVHLLGVPANTAVETNPLKITPETTELRFPVTITDKARPATYRSLACRAIITINNEPITQTAGGGQLRVDRPLPPKPVAKPAPQKEKPRVIAKPPAPKPLSRLEQLRQQKAKEAAAP